MVYVIVVNCIIATLLLSLLSLLILLLSTIVPKIEFFFMKTAF